MRRLTDIERTRLTYLTHGDILSFWASIGFKWWILSYHATIGEIVREGGRKERNTANRESHHFWAWKRLHEMTRSVSNKIRCIFEETPKKGDVGRPTVRKRLMGKASHSPGVARYLIFLLSHEKMYNQMNEALSSHEGKLRQIKVKRRMVLFQLQFSIWKYFHTRHLWVWQLEEKMTIASFSLRSPAQPGIRYRTVTWRGKSKWSVCSEYPQATLHFLLSSFYSKGLNWPSKAYLTTTRRTVDNNNVRFSRRDYPLVPGP